jgi:hypothetical protein
MIKYIIALERTGGDVVSPELEIDATALSYLVTVVIRRLHDIDPAWCRDLLAETQSRQNGCARWLG